METFKYALAVFMRIVSVLVGAPAAAALAIFGFAYQFSFHAATLDAYIYIEKIARIQKDEQPGFLTIRECSKDRQVESGSALPPLSTCERHELKQVSIDTLAEEAAATLSTAYWMLVLLGLGINIVVMGPRRFFMMEKPEETPNQATPVERR